MKCTNQLSYLSHSCSLDDCRRCRIYLCHCPHSDLYGKWITKMQCSRFGGLTHQDILLHLYHDVQHRIKCSYIFASHLSQSWLVMRITKMFWSLVSPLVTNLTRVSNTREYSLKTLPLYHEAGVITVGWWRPILELTWESFTSCSLSVKLILFTFHWFPPNLASPMVVHLLWDDFQM